VSALPIPCEEARALLDERLDGTLAGADAAALRVHLDGCAACREDAAALAAVDGALRADGIPDPGPAFSDRVVAALDRGPSRAPPARTGGTTVRGLVAFAGTAAFAALAVALLPFDGAAATVTGLVPEIALPAIPAPPIPAVLAGFGGILPAWAAAAGALVALGGAAAQVALLRRGGLRRGGLARGGRRP
jgi:hypothetical protein